MWKKILIDKTQIEFTKDPFVLIKLPHKSIYRDYSFWHLSNLVICEDEILRFLYKDDFKFKLIRYKKDQYNRSGGISDMEVSSKVIEILFEV